MRDERYRRLHSVCLRAYPFVTLAVGKRIRNRVFSAVDWGKKEPDFRCRGLGKRTRNRMFNDTDFWKEKRKLARFLKEM